MYQCGATGSTPRRAALALEGFAGSAVFRLRRQRASPPPARTRSDQRTSCAARARGRAPRSCRSRAAPRVAANTARASRLQSAAEWRVERCTSASMRTSRVARELRRLPAVLCPVSAARAASSSVKVASCTSTSASCAAIASASHGARVAGDHELAPLARGAHHLLGRHTVDGLPALQAPEVRPGRHAELLGERAGPGARAGSPRPARTRRPCRGGGARARRPPCSRRTRRPRPAPAPPRSAHTAGARR